MTTLEGLHALVTGGGSGIGLACAKALLDVGATVTICGRTSEKLEAVAARLDRGEQLRWTVCDVGEEDDVRAAVQLASGPDGGLDVAVASAGTVIPCPILTTTVENWEAVQRTNLRGVFLMIKHAGRAMATSGGGSIVVISSVASPLTFAYLGAYTASKAGADRLVDVAADELGRWNVRVNSVQPGLVIETDMGQSAKEFPEFIRDHEEQMPLGRVGEPSEVAAAVMYFAGPGAAWTTGQHLAVDGGHRLRRGGDYSMFARMIMGGDGDGIDEVRPASSQ